MAKFAPDFPGYLLCTSTDVRRRATVVVGDSMSGREDTREDGIPRRMDFPKGNRRGVRAIIRAKKRGNARGAKGGRLVNGETK